MPDSIIPNVVVSMPSQLFTLARSFKAASNGSIYIGKINTDPTIPSNQIQVYIENEDGSHVPTAQPININIAGYPVYNGQITKFVTVKGHSMAVYDSYGAQQFYFPNVLKYDPDQFRQELATSAGASFVGYKTSTVSNYLDTLTDYVPVEDICPDLNANNRDTIFNHSGNVFVGKGVSVRCNLLPTDDVRKFVGEGTVLTLDPWGHEQVFNVDLAVNGSNETASMRFNAAAVRETGSSIGVIGDSITDGVATDGFIPNPVDSNGNLNSINYNHSNGGGGNAWFRYFSDVLGLAYYGVVNQGKVRGYNASHQGASIMDGWPYRNLDYGFFQNAAYGNKMPDIVMFAMGVNDIGQSGTYTNDQLIDEIDKFVRKCWGYGATVVFCSTVTANFRGLELELSAKRYFNQKYPLIDYIDIAESVFESYTNLGVGGNSTDAIRLVTSPVSYWDILHPAQGAHYQMGSYAAYAFAPNRFIHAKPDTKFLPTSHEKIIVETYDGKIGTIANPLSSPASIPTGGSMVSQWKWWPYANTGKPLYIRYMIWCDADQSIDLSAFYLTPSIYPGSVTKSMTVILSHMVRALLPTYPSCIASINEEIEPVNSLEYKTTHVSRLRRGLNILEIAHNNTPTYASLPMLYFNDAKALGYSRRSLNGLGSGVNTTSGIAVIDGQSEVITYPAKITFSGRSVTDEAPDLYQCGLGEVIQSAKFEAVSPLSNFSVVLRYKPSAGRYIILYFAGTPGAYVVALEIHAVSGVTTQTAPISNALYDHIAGGKDFEIISTATSTGIIVERIGSVTLNYGFTGGLMAIRKINPASALNFRVIDAGCHFIGRSNPSSNQNQQPV